MHDVVHQLLESRSKPEFLHVDVVSDFLTEQTRLLVFIPDASPELSRKIILVRAHTSSLVSNLYILLLSLIFELSRTSVQVSMAS